MRKYFYFLLIILLFPVASSSWAQIVTRIGEVSVCPGPAEVPILVSGLQNLGSLSLKMRYDTSKLICYGVARKHQALQSGVWLDNIYEDRILFSWFSIAPVNIGSDTLAILSMELLSGPAIIRWDTALNGQCSYTDPLGELLPAYFEDGVIASDFVIPTQISPANNGVFNTDILVFHWDTCGCGAIYELEIAQDNDFQSLDFHYQHLPTPLRIVNSLHLNTKYFWRVRACIPNLCTPWSETWSFNTGTAGIWAYEGKEHLHVYPNPVKDFMHIQVPGYQNYNSLLVVIYDIHGAQIWSHKYQAISHNSLIIPLHTIESGLYILRVIPDGVNLTSAEFYARFIKI